MTKKSDGPIMLVAILIVVSLVIGEIVVYTSDYTDYSADATLEDGTVSYSVSADGSKVYSVIVNDNGQYLEMEHLYIYYDSNYASNVEKVNVAIGAKELDQEYYVEQLVPTLRYRNVTEVTIVDAARLPKVLEKDLGTDGIATAGLVVLSGALPDTVYKGSADDPIFDWLSEGGRLYWLGNTLGSFYSTPDGTVPVEGYQQLFFGTECLNTDPELDKAYEEVLSNRYCSTLSIMNNNVRYSLSGANIGTDRQYLGLGFTNGGYDSIGLVSHGKGMICVLGGDYSNNQRNDLAQVIASGLTPSSQIVGYTEGSVTRGTVEGTIDIVGTGSAAYIYLGGYYPVFGKLIQL